MHTTKDRRNEEAPRVHAGPLRGREGGRGRDVPVLRFALIHPSAWKNSTKFVVAVSEPRHVVAAEHPSNVINQGCHVAERRHKLSEET
jgi:hypothetical protein